ncbi:MAG: VWA domain-containing protein [Parachlamydiaceae bacterium]|nr:VWA domain-containing protein [Parachlamydiaceae bacterium]
MIEFLWPYMFLLIPLPLVIYKLLPVSAHRKTSALMMSDLTDVGHFQNSSAFGFSKIKLFLMSLVWLTLLASAARPQFNGPPVEIPQSGRDLMLAVDLSGSMQFQDFEIKGKYTDRLTALKLIAGDFIDRRKGDRIGLILFGSNAYLQTPLTFDTVTVKQFLMEAEVGLAGKETAIGDAIGLAVKQLRDTPQASRVLILLTDGNNNAGELTPEKAAEIASRSNLKIHTVAIGAKSMVVQTVFGPQMMNPSADIDEKALKAVAEITGGKYFRAYNTQELVHIYQEIDQLEPTEQSKQHFRPTDEVYYWPLLFALIFTALGILFASLKGEML